jgi:ribonuclease Z
VNARFEVILLGCGAAAPNLRFMTTSQVVNIHENWILFDAGEGVQLNLRRMKVPFNKIHNICISHMHGDHVLGLPGLIGSMNLLGRKTELKLFGPTALEPWLMENLRLTETHLNFHMKFRPLEPDASELLIEKERFKLTSFPTRHRIPTHGFRIQEAEHPWRVNKEAIQEFDLSINEIKTLKSGESVRKGAGEIAAKDAAVPGRTPRSYAYAADTRPSDEVIESVEGVSVLYHEATFQSALAKRAKETGHSTAAQAAEVALKAKVGKLVLGHFSARYRVQDGLLAEAKAIFQDTELGYDGMIIRI